MANKGYKQIFVDYMKKKEVINGRPYTDDEKRVAWLVWQYSWTMMRGQIRREMQEITRKKIKAHYQRIREKLKNEEVNNETAST
jgi:hypothetical protein